MSNIAARLASLFRPELSALSAYHVADATGYIKLDAMENPYTWPEEVIGQWLEALRHCPLNRYPDPQARQLTAMLKQQIALSADCELLLGNGSDEIIQILLMALPPDAAVLAPEPTFVMYRQIARSLGLSFCGVPLQAADFALDLPAMLEAIERHRPALVFLAYPNNPSGNLFEAAAVRTILDAAPGLVVLDEAYAPFTDASFMPQLQDFDNLLVMRTLSKLGLAGLRLGYLAGRRAIIGELDKIRLPYNINVLTQSSAHFALRQETLFAAQTAAIRAERTVLLQQLQTLPGIAAFPSDANFILFRSTAQDADRLFAALKEQGILIKNLHPQGGLLHGCLRVTVGTPEENQAFLAALRKSL
ncbi:MAG: histidinol-phosphate transaminase [Gammaproteobacteria bacterium]